MDNLLYTSYCNIVKSDLDNSDKEKFSNLIKDIGPIEKLIKKDNLKSKCNSDYTYTIDKINILLKPVKNNLVKIFCMNIMIHIILNNMDFIKRHKRFSDVLGNMVLQYIDMKDNILLYENIGDDTIKLCYTIKTVIDIKDNVM